MQITVRDKQNVVSGGPLVADSEFSWFDVARQTVQDELTWTNALTIAGTTAAVVATGGGALVPVLASQVIGSAALSGAFNAIEEYIDPSLIGVNSVQTETDKIRSLGGKASVTVHEVMRPVDEALHASRIVLKLGKAYL